MVDLGVKKPPDFSLEGFCIGYMSLVHAFLLFRIEGGAMEKGNSPNLITLVAAHEFQDFLRLSRGLTRCFTTFLVGKCLKVDND